MKQAKSQRLRGRPREFDPEAALDRALELFWRQGYEGTSIADLTAAIGVNRPSLYAAFGNKEALFRKALDRYLAGPTSYFLRALAEPTARKVAEHLLCCTVKALSDSQTPAGCLVVQGALCSGGDAEPIRQTLAAERQRCFEALRLRFERALVEGDLPAGAKPSDLARYLSTVLHGLAVQATGGASGRELQRVADLALRAFP